MLAKLLKRKESRQAMDLANPHIDQGQQQTQSEQQPQLQYRYQRPDLLGKLTETELSNNASHMNRPVVVPKNGLCLDCIGYAEAINAGKSRYNEDQACIFQGQLRPRRNAMKAFNYLYVGLFDGHGGPGCAVKASKELQQIIHEGLDDALDLIVEAYKLEMSKNDRNGGTRRRSSLAPKVNGIEDKEISHGLEEVRIVNGILPSDDEEEDFDEDEYNEEKEVKMSLDELISGALESAFWAMDKLILKDKEAGFRISGGSCALVALFILDKLYIANAGDCRACIYDPLQPILVPMSYDFTPESDRQRIQLIAYQRPELLRHPVTKEKLYNRHVLSRKPKHDEVGMNTIMYRDFYMAGWSCRDVTSEDVRLVPLITGRGKQCRLLGTVGVARGLGDHDLIVKSSMVNCKEFLTCQPEVRVKAFDELSEGSMLVMASDGLWDVMTNANVHTFFKTAPPSLQSVEDFAKGLVLEARGEQVPDGFWEKSNGDLASGDDITCFTVSIAEVKRALIKADQKL